MQHDIGVNYKIDSMFLPPWARIMREALESKHVTENIGNWIDLMFGIH
jgi:hypothetical protein